MSIRALVFIDGVQSRCFLSILLTVATPISKCFPDIVIIAMPWSFSDAKFAIKAETASLAVRSDRRQSRRRAALLRRLSVVEPEDAIAKWKAGVIDAVVAPDEEQPRLLRDLEGVCPLAASARSLRTTIVLRVCLLTRSKLAKP